MKRLLVCLAALPLVLSGCWTVRETAIPDVSVGKLPEGREVRVQVAGFDAVVTSYLPVYGYATVSTWDNSWYGWHGRRRYGGFRTETVSTTDFVPQVASTSAYRDRAADALEKGGCILQAAEPKYRVEVRFDGPFGEDGDGWAKFGWMVGTLFTANFEAQTWSAKLKIHDCKSGKLLHEKDFSQRYEVVVWGPIPIFSPGSSEKTSNGYMQHVCLSTLTDLAVADALAYLGQQGFQLSRFSR